MYIFTCAKLMLKQQQQHRQQQQLQQMRMQQGSQQNFMQVLPPLHPPSGKPPSCLTFLCSVVCIPLLLFAVFLLLLRKVFALQFVGAVCCSVLQCRVPQ